MCYGDPSATEVPPCCETATKKFTFSTTSVLLLLNMPLSLSRATIFRRQKNPRRVYRPKIAGILFVCNEPEAKYYTVPIPTADKERRMLVHEFRRRVTSGYIWRRNAERHSDARWDGSYGHPRIKKAHLYNINCSHFAAVYLCGVAIPVSGPFLPDVPGFQVPPDSIFPRQLRSSSRALPLHLHFDNCSDVFCFISCFDVPEPVQPSSFYNHRYGFDVCFKDLPISPVI